MEIKKIEKSDFVMFPRMQHRGLEFRHVERNAFKAELRHVDSPHFPPPVTVPLTVPVS